jgi:hypothetical protein
MRPARLLIGVLAVLGLAGCGGGGSGKSVTLVLDPMPDISGFMSATGDQFETNVDSVLIGDLTLGMGGGEEGMRILLSFDIASIPAGARVESARLRLRQGVLSPTSPYPLLGSVVVDQVVYGTVLDLGAYDRSFPVNQGFATLSDNGNLEDKETDVTPAVLLDRMEMRTQSQFRLRFTTETNGDDLGEFAEFEGPFLGATHHPVLIVTYRE